MRDRRYKNEDQVSLIKKVLNRMEKVIKHVSGNNKSKIKEKEKIFDIVERIIYFNQLEQSGKGLKILTPNQMLIILPIPLAQIKAGNNFEKLKNEIRQLMHSLYRSKKLTKRLYKSLIDII